jgi:hypothetical protein
MDKFMAGVAYTLTQIFIGAFVLLLFVHVIIDIAQLYDVPLVLNYTYPQIFGGILVLRMITRVGYIGNKRELKKLVQEEDKSSPLQNFGYSILNQFIFTLMILGSWLSAYVMYWLFI